MQYNANLLSDVLGKRRFADFVVDTFEHFRADTIFGMPAESLTPLVDAIRRNGRLRFVSVRHEGAGALMASAYAKLTGRLGIIVGTAGPGVTHLPVGTYDARADDAPIIAWCGQVPIHQVGSGGFQEVSSALLMADSAGAVRTIGSETQTTAIALACADALRHRCVSVIETSNDILTRPVAPHSAVHMDPELMVATAILDVEGLERAARELGRARGEAVVVVGDVGGQPGGQPLIESLAARLAAPVVVVPEGIHYLQAPPRQLTLRCAGPRRRAIEELVRKAREVVVVGPMRQALRALLSPAARIVHVAPPSEMAKPVVGGAIRLCGPIAQTVAALTERLPAAGAGALLDEARGLDDTGDGAGAAFWERLDAALPDDAVVALEPGSILDAAFCQLPARARAFTSSFNHGARCYALPAAIAGTLAFPERRSIALASAEGLSEMMAELLTARKFDLPAVTLCFQRKDAAQIDFAGYARAAGAFAAVVDSLDGLVDTVQAALGSGQPAVVTVNVAAAATARLMPVGGAVAALEPAAEARAGDAPTFAEWLVDALARAGVDRIYGRNRPAIQELIAATEADGRLDFFDVVHAESAAMMASAHSKWTRRVGVCVTADAQDLLLNLNGLFDASFDHNPLLILSPAAVPGGVDPVRLLEGVATRRLTLQPDESAARRLAEVISECSRGPCVTHVAVDWARLHEPMAPVPDWFQPVQQPEVYLPSRPALEEAVERLAAAGRPALLVGRGGVGARDEIVALSELLQAPIVVTLPGLAAVPTSHPNVVGCNGSSGHRTAVETLEQCDVLLILGSSNRGAIFGLVGRFFIIQVDSDPTQLGRRDFGTLALRGSVKETVRMIVELLRARGVSAAARQLPPPSALHRLAAQSGFNRLIAGLSTQRIDELEDGPLKRTLAILVDTPVGEAVQALVRRARGGDRGPLLARQRERFERWRAIDQRQHESSAHHPIAPPAICRVVQKVLDRRGDRAIATVDVGVMTLWVLRHFEGGSHDVVWAASFASMGFAMPAAIAIAATRPGRPVIAFVGDGGIAITMAELANAVARELPLVVVIFNNGKLAAVKFELEVMGWPEYGAGLVNGDLAGYAEACGARGIQVTRIEQLEAAVEEALSCGRPCVIDVVCDGDYMPAPPKVHISQGRGYAVALLREAGLAARSRLQALRAPRSDAGTGIETRRGRSELPDRAH